MAYQRQGKTRTDLEQALDNYVISNGLLVSLVEASHENIIFKGSLAVSHGHLGITYLKLKKYTEATVNFNEYEKLGEQLVYDYPANVNYQSIYAEAIVTNSAMKNLHLKNRNLEVFIRGKETRKNKSPKIR
jgi:hypothetical protein